MMLFEISLKFSLPMHVLYKLNLSSFLSFNFSSYLFSNFGAKQLELLYLSCFLCSAMKLLSGLLICRLLITESGR